jgi:hypothetical protein
MSNLVNHAKYELEKAGLFNSEGDFYGGMTGKAVLELVECFAKQGHSGMSASVVANLFKDVSSYKPLSPITCEDDEWSNEIDGRVFQNKRCPAIFKEGKNGRPYYLDAIVWTEKNGNAFTGKVNDISSCQFIKLPFIPKTFYVLIDEERNIIGKDELQKAFEYYAH